MNYTTFPVFELGKKTAAGYNPQRADFCEVYDKLGAVATAHFEIFELIDGKPVEVLNVSVPLECFV